MPAETEVKEQKQEPKPGEHFADLPENKEGWTPATDPLLRELMDGFGEKPIPDPAPEKKEEKEAEQEKPNEKQSEEKKDVPEREKKTPSDQEPTKVEEKKKRVSFDDVVNNLPDGIQPSQDGRSQPVQAQPDPDSDYIATLSTDIQDDIQEAADVERALGEKYSGHKKKLVAYYKEVDSLVEKLRKEDPARTLDENDDEFIRQIASLKKRKPTIPQSDRRKAERILIKEEVRSEVERELKPKLTEIERKNLLLEEKPRLEAAMNKFSSSIQELVSGSNESIAKAMQSSEDERPAFALELDLVEAHVEHAKKLASEFLGVRRGLIEFDPKKLSPTQAEVNEFLVQTGEEFEKTGGKLTVNQAGQKFMPLHKYNALANKVHAGKADASELDKVWTFNEAQVLGLIAVKAKNDIEAELKAEEARAKRYGYQRVASNSSETKTQKVEKKEEKVEALNPPKSKVTPSSGVSDKQTKKIEDDPFNPVVAFGLNA